MMESSIEQESSVNGVEGGIEKDEIRNDRVPLVQISEEFARLINN